MAQPTHIQHVIKNSTPYAFYYDVAPITELPSAFSCACAGVISPGDQQFCDCYSDLEPNYRRYRIEYMKKMSPSYRESVSHSADTNTIITWEFTFNSYWNWISVISTHAPIV